MSKVKSIITIVFLFFIPFFFIYIKNTAVTSSTNYSCDFILSDTQYYEVTFDVSPYGGVRGGFYQKDNRTGRFQGFTFNNKESFYGIIDNSFNFYPKIGKDLFREKIKDYCNDKKSIICMKKGENIYEKEFMKWNYSKVVSFNWDETSNIKCNSSEYDELLKTELVNTEALICIFRNEDMECKNNKYYMTIN